MVRAYFFLSLLFVASRVRVLVFLVFVYWLFLYYANAPGLFGGRGEMAMAVPCCHPLYGTACAVGLTWRPLTGSLFLSSFWCRLKPCPSGERGRKSSLLQDMLDTGRPTRTTGGRSSRGLTGNDPRTVGRRYHLESRVCSEIQGDQHLESRVRSEIQASERF